MGSVLFLAPPLRMGPVETSQSPPSSCVLTRKLQALVTAGSELSAPDRPSAYRAIPVAQASLCLFAFNQLHPPSGSCWGRSSLSSASARSVSLTLHATNVCATYHSVLTPVLEFLR